ncbi:MAG: hypothetical protein FWG03_04350 [Clostridiales bacterium]|nr:hypothetical protein [Clostridiales bacterium]
MADLKRFVSKYFIFALIAGTFWLIATICGFTGVITTYYVGFAVDGNGLLYVGKDKKLDVYDNDKYVRTICRAQKGYRFTIRDERIYFATPSSAREIDFSGNIIKEFGDMKDNGWKQLDKEQKVFVTDDAVYKATNTLGFYKITRFGNDGSKETVYHMRIIDYIIGVAMLVVVIVAVILFFTWFAREGPLVDRVF